MQEKTEISVIMSVYNTEEDLLRRAIESILNQSFPQFEFIIIDDGCDRNTKNILSEYREKDRRICIINNDINIGLTKSLNKGLEFAKGKYIARMDADDFSMKDRFEKQYAFMEKHKRVSILGTTILTDGGEKKRYTKIPGCLRKVELLFHNCGIAHPSAFIRTSFLKDNGIKYDESKLYAQDYKLWVECIKYGARFAVIEFPLVYLNVGKNQVSSKYAKKQQESAFLICAEQLNCLVPTISINEWLNLLFCESYNQDNKKGLLESFRQVEVANDEKKLFRSNLLRYQLDNEYYKRTRENRRNNILYKIYNKVIKYYSCH